MKQQQMGMGGGPTFSLKGGMATAPPPQMAHTLPMTHRSQYGGASKGRVGAYSAIGGGSFAPSLSSSSFFTRHNPHPGRVRHINGLLNVPICHVSDDGFMPRERTLQTPERRSIYNAYKVPSSVSQFPIFPTDGYGIRDYDVFATKGVPYKKVPMVPRWFEELKDISNRAGLEPSPALDHQQQQQKASYSKKTGRLNEAPSRAMSRSGHGGMGSRAGRLLTGQSRQGQFTGAINKQPDNEALVMELLSQILQSDSINFIQQWLCQSTEQEKEAVCEMIRIAMASDQQAQAAAASYSGLPENSSNGVYGPGFKRDEFLDNKQTTNAQVDRLVVDDQQETAAADYEAPAAHMTPTKLPDINQHRTTSRLSDHVKQQQPTVQQPTNQMHARFEGLEPLAENEQEFVEYRTLDGMPGGEQVVYE